MPDKPIKLVQKSNQLWKLLVVILSGFLFLAVVYKAAPGPFLIVMVGVMVLFAFLILIYVIKSYRKEHEPINVMIHNVEKDLIRAFPELNGNIDVTPANLLFKRFDNDTVFEIKVNGQHGQTMVVTYSPQLGVTGWYTGHLFTEIADRESSLWKRELGKRLQEEKIKAELYDQAGVMPT